VCSVGAWVEAIVDHSATQEAGTPTQSAELPTEWRGTPLRPLALSEVELRFARHFPARSRAMTDGRQVLVLRTVDQPTRMLHPAADCYRGLGDRVRDEQLEGRTDQARRRQAINAVAAVAARCACVNALKTRRARALPIRPPGTGHRLPGESTGPWKAITVATPL